MKKVLVIALLACMVLTLCSCSQNADTKEESKGKVSVVSLAESAESSEVEPSQEEKKEESKKEESSKTESSKAESKEESKKESTEESSKEESGKEESSAPAVESSVPESSAEASQLEESKVEESSQEESKMEEESSIALQMGTFSSTDLSLIYNNGAVSLHQNISDAIAILGNAAQVEEVPSCLGTSSGPDKIYSYNSFQIQTLTDNEGEKIYHIDIIGADTATSKGIRIGSSTADIENAYGPANEQDEMLYSYTTDNGKTKLEFFIEDNSVTEIIYSYAPNL